MKKILVVLLTLACVFTVSIPSSFAAKDRIPFWQHGYGMSTFIAITTRDPAQLPAYASTGATITVTLTAADTAGGYTVIGTGSAFGGSANTSGLEFAVAKFLDQGLGKSMMIDTNQINNTSGGTVVWTTGSTVTSVPAATSTTTGKFGFGMVDTGTAAAGNYDGWICVYSNSTNAGWTVDLGNF